MSRTSKSRIPARLPLCCRPAAFDLLGRQIASLASPDALLNAAVAISMHELGTGQDGVQPDAIDRALQRMANEVRQRVRGNQPQAILAHLHEYLFDEQGFVGNGDEYYAAANSYLPSVLKAKRGLPITLSLVYKIVAERVGLRVNGIGLPGHFIVSVEGCDSTGNSMLIDPFNGGQMLSPDEAHCRLQHQFGPEMEWSEELLEPVSNLHWLTRMLQNLLHVFGGADRYTDVAAMLELEMLLWPDEVHLQRDLALVLARLDRTEAASVWLGKYLQANPDDPQRDDLKKLLSVMET